MIAPADEREWESGRVVGFCCVWGGRGERKGGGGGGVCLVGCEDGLEGRL